MDNENEKKGLFARLNVSKKAKKCSCCCNFEVEEIPEEDIKENKNEKVSKDKGDSCC